MCKTCNQETIPNQAVLYIYNNVSGREVGARGLPARGQSDA